MAVREVLLYPDPLLKERCDPIVDFGPEVAALVTDLLDTMAASPGCGLAAPQIGVLKRVVVIDVTAKHPDRTPLILINPTLSELADHKIIREGCLSIPELTANVLRADSIRVKAQDASGAWVEHACSGLEAIAVQHEVDHLDGVLFLDRVACLDTDIFRRKVKKKA